MNVADATGAAERVDDRVEPWRGAGRALLAWFLLAATVTIAGNIVLREFPTMPFAVRALLALASVPPLVGVIACSVRVLRRMDELERRIQAEALGSAFGVLGLLLVVYGQAQTAFGLTPEPWTVVWPISCIVYGACLVMVRRRYA